MKTPKTKYRIVTGYNRDYIVESSRLVYKLQKRSLWFFWRTVSDYPMSVYSLEEVRGELERLKLRYEKSTVYEE